MSAHLEVAADVALLDFDGLVIDTEFAGWASWHELYRRFGRDLSQATWAEQCGRAALFEPWQDLEATASATLDRAQLDVARRARRDELLTLLPGVREFLETALARGQRVGLVSNSPEDWIRRNLARNDVDPALFSVIVAGPTYAAKPSPERYRAALRALEVDSAAVVAVEDSPKGIRAAVAAGLRCVAVPNRITRHCDLGEAHHRIPSLDRLHLRPSSGARGRAPADSRMVPPRVRAYLTADAQVDGLLCAVSGTRVDLSALVELSRDAAPETVKAAAAAALLLLTDRVLAERRSGEVLELAVWLGSAAHRLVVERLLAQLAPDALLVLHARDRLADLIGLDAAAFVLPADEAAWPSALARLLTTTDGGCTVTPTPAEQAMMAASVAASRSAALRGGVGAALVDHTGETLVLGTTEVPRAGGGQYWDGDPDDARDFRLGSDPATAARRATVERLLALARAGGAAIPDALGVDALLAAFDRSEEATGVGWGGPLARTFESLGRVVHAEMAVLCNAARIGLAVRGLTLYVTAGSCRQCLRHAVCSGIARIVCLGPALRAVPAFLADSVTVETSPGERVALHAFEGFTPAAFRARFGRAEAGAALDPPANVRWLGLVQACATFDVDGWREALSPLPQVDELLRELHHVQRRLQPERQSS